MSTIENVREYWNTRPCNIRHSQKPVGTLEYSNEVQEKKYFVEPHIKEFADFPRWNGKRVLEIGCGIGTDTLNFARHGAKVTAIDLSEVTLEVAKQRAVADGLQDKITFLCGNAEDLTGILKEEQIFDLVYSFGVLHHTPHPALVFRHLNSYMSQDSELRIMLYHRWSWKSLEVFLRKARGNPFRFSDALAFHSEAQPGCPVTRSYSRASARTFLEQNGFRVTESKIRHIFRYSVPEYVQNQYRVVWYFRWIPQLVFQCLERLFGWHLCLIARKSTENNGRAWN